MIGGTKRKIAAAQNPNRRQRCASVQRVNELSCSANPSATTAARSAFNSNIAGERRSFGMLKWISRYDKTAANANAPKASAQAATFHHADGASWMSASLDSSEIFRFILAAVACRR